MYEDYAEVINKQEGKEIIDQTDVSPDMFEDYILATS